VPRHRQQQGLERHVGVAELARLVLGGAQDLTDGVRGRRLARGVRARVGGEAGERRLEVRADGLGLGPELSQEWGDVVEDDGKQVLWSHLRVAALGGEGDRGLQRLLGLDGEAIGVHRGRTSF
jgi:hypothetical protein